MKFTMEQFHRYTKLVGELVEKKAAHIRRLGLDAKALDKGEGRWEDDDQN
jgi:hypothetical protein